MVAAAVARIANLQLNHTPTGRTLNVTVPSDIKHTDFNLIGRSIIDIINKHTGCTCLSGVIPVVLQDELAQVVKVDLKEIH